MALITAFCGMPLGSSECLACSSGVDELDLLELKLTAGEPFPRTSRGLSFGLIISGPLRPPLMSLAPRSRSGSREIDHDRVVWT